MQGGGRFAEPKVTACTCVHGGPCALQMGLQEAQFKFYLTVTNLHLIEKPEQCEVFSRENNLIVSVGFHFT